jgi:hypothetical protein
VVLILRLRVLYRPQNKQQLLSYTKLSDWFCITDVESVYYAVRTESVYKTGTFSIQGLTGSNDETHATVTKSPLPIYRVRINHRSILQNLMTCILCNEIVHTTFGSTSQEDHDVQIAVGTRVEPPQIPGHTNCARSASQPFPSDTGLRFSREMAVATIGPLQMLLSLCVIDTNFTILRHFLLKLWRNEFTQIIYTRPVYHFFPRKYALGIR